jgi:hypothetical protein
MLDQLVLAEHLPHWQLAIKPIPVQGILQYLVVLLPNALLVLLMVIFVLIPLLDLGKFITVLLRNG